MLALAQYLLLYSIVIVTPSCSPFESYSVCIESYLTCPQTESLKLK